jgi:hypothetical protein
MSPTKLTRREFMSRTGKIALATGFPGALMSGCARATFRKKSWEEVLGGDNYSRLTQLWDPVYGPPVQEFSRYGGVGDFRGHIRGGATPGIDYDVPKGFPLVPSTTSYLRQIQRDNNGALYVLLMDVYSPSYFTYLGHLQEVLVDEKFLLVGEIGKYLREGIRALGRQEVVALSGNSGLGPKEYGWVQPPHLHYSLYSWNATKRALENLDPDQYGVDGGKPVLWDGNRKYVAGNSGGWTGSFTSRCLCDRERRVISFYKVVSKSIQPRERPQRWKAQNMAGIQRRKRGLSSSPLMN